MTKVLIIGTSRFTRGGITSVIKAHRTGKQWAEYHCHWIATHRGGYKWRKGIYLILGLIQFFIFAPFYNIYHMHVSFGMSLKRKCFYMKWAKKWHKKTIIHFHPPGPHVLQNEEDKPRFRYLFENADVILVLSEQWKRWIKEYIGFEDSKMRVLFNPCPTVKRDVTNKKKQLLFAGQLLKRKGYLDLVQAFSKLSTKYPDWQLIIAGHGDIDGGKKLADELGVGKQVKWLGWISGTDKDRAFNESSIYCLPSYGEGFPMGVLDAWAYGLPCVVTPVGGMPDIVRDGEEALVFPVGDIEAMANKLDILMSDPSLREQMVQTTDRYVSGLFNIQNINKQLGSIYEQLSKETQ